MNEVSKFLALMALLGGCAEKHLIENEKAVLAQNTVTSRSRLVELEEHSALLSAAYSEAAREASNDQDALAFVTFIAAASFVKGYVGSASDTALANTAIAGAGATSVATRTLSQTTIKGIYVAAKRMNCISTAAGMGAFLLDGTSNLTKGVARAATFGAIEEIKITTREALVRTVANYENIRDDLIGSISVSEAEERMLNTLENGGAELVRLNQYLGILDNCVGAKETATAVAPIPKDNP